MRISAKRIGVALGAALLSGCGGTPAPTSAPPPFILPSSAAALSPAVYLALASNSSLFAIRASELALERSTSGAVRDAARAIIADQGGVGSQLSYAGRRLDLLPSATLPPEMAGDLERLRGAGDFETEYRRLVGAALARSLDAHQSFAATGASPTLRPVAEMAAPVTRKNLDALKR